ncbi:MAG: ABC transporter ATP-binding protein [Parvibaculaceae bacterium]
MPDEAPRRTQASVGGAVNLRGVTKRFGEFQAVGDVTLDIRPNEFFTLLGPSGCGKTTLLRMIAGFEMPTDGAILLDGSDISSFLPNERPVNTVFQNYALFPHMTVGENVGFGLRMLRRPKLEIKATVGEMLALVQLEGRGDSPVTQLSGGQQQRVALARALAPRPKVLLLDEPLSALDLKLRKSMQIELKRLQSETGITFIFVTHDQEEALSMSDRIAVMADGAVRQVGTPREIYDRPSDGFVADFIGETNFIAANVASVGGGRARVTLPSGASIAATVPDGLAPSGQVTLVIRPEHARITSPGDNAALTGTVTNVVFIGTDTHLHVRIDDALLFVVREQNAGSRQHRVAAGDRVGISIGDGDAQIVKDRP